jgi:hypothetical protein
MARPDILSVALIAGAASAVTWYFTSKNTSSPDASGSAGNQGSGSGTGLPSYQGGVVAEANLGELARISGATSQSELDFYYPTRP